MYGLRSPLVLIVPLTSQDAALRFPVIASLQPDATNGLSLPSYAMVFQTRALDRSRFLRPLGRLSGDDLRWVLGELVLLAGLDSATVLRSRRPDLAETNEAIDDKAVLRAERIVMRDGVPCVRDLGVSVKTVVSMLADGKQVDEVVSAFSGLELEDVMACLQYAADRVFGQEPPPSAA